MKLARPGDTVPFTPFDQIAVPAEKRVRYHFRVPTVADQARFDHGVAEDGGRRWAWLQLLGALEDGIRDLMPDEADEERQAILAETGAARQEIQAVADLLRSPEIAGDDEARLAAFERWQKAESSPRLAELDALVGAHYPRLRQMQADNKVYNLIRGTTACRMFLSGWENVPGKIRRGIAGADEATLKKIPDHHRAAIGVWCMALFGPSEAEAKN